MSRDIESMSERAEATRKIYAPIMGIRIIDAGVEFEVVDVNDLGIPYFSKVVSGKKQKKQFTIRDKGVWWSEQQLTRVCSA